MTKSNLFSILSKSSITIALIALGAWLVNYASLERKVHYKIYEFTEEEAQRLAKFPQSQYDFGRQAWMGLDAASAADYFHQAISQDVLHIDSWIGLAEAEAALGNSNKALAILAHADSRLENVYRWKWPLLLLAHDLGADDIFFRNINYLIAHNENVQDAYQLMDDRLRGDVVAAVSMLHRDNLSSYLKWLMRWKRVDDTYQVWEKVVDFGEPDQDFVRHYVHFLIRHKRIQKAELVWQPYSDTNGMTNAGFETEITQKGFDWRYYKVRNDLWKIERVKSPIYKGSYALRIFFAGLENISFQHLNQIIPVEPQNSYRLSFTWQSREITTDQGPFVEIYGYACDGLYHKGSMINGTNDWQKEKIEFVPPEGCEAVVVRLRRSPSKRFDSKISGTMWLDDFRLEKLNPQITQIHAD